MKMSGETTLDKHSASWLNSKSNPLNSDNNFENKNELNNSDNKSKPKWFEEMIKNTEDLDKSVQSTIQDEKEETENIFDLKPILENKENKSNDIHSKRRNTLNILHNENQNFLNTLSNLNTSKSAKPFLDASIDTVIKDETKIDSIKNDLPNELSELINLTKSSKLEQTIDEAGKKSEQNSFDEEFIIPEAPSGKQLTIVLKSNYGDDNFIGLNGVEIFDVKSFKNIANSNIKFLNNLDSNPEKLFDQTYRTHDENHIWKSKFNKNTAVELKLEFESVKQIAIIRIWNYNRSRIYSYIGVKEMCIYLDGTKIFSGEIAKANGELKGDLNNFGDTILYTTDENILEQIYKNDTSFREYRDATTFDKN